MLRLLSALVLLLLLLPPDGRYDEAISFQLDRGAPTAWGLLIAKTVTLSYVAVRLWRWENRVWAVASGLVVLSLAVIAVTSPTSSAHNGVFITMSGFILLGHFGFFYGHLDYRLLPTALAAVFAVFLCFTHLGLGERLLIAASLAAMNVLVYGYLDP